MSFAELPNALKRYNPEKFALKHLPLIISEGTPVIFDLGSQLWNLCTTKVESGTNLGLQGEHF